MYKARLAALTAVMVACGVFSANPASAEDGSATTLLISVGGAETYMLDPVTGQIGQKIGNGPGGVISPDHSKVAYVRNYDECPPQPEGGCQGGEDLLTSNLDGTDEKPVSVGGFYISHSWPDWSPSGKKILFRWNEPYAGGALAWVNADGTGEENLVLTGDPTGCGRFSPDGKKIAYEANGNIQVMDVDSRKTTALNTDGSADYLCPSWSPDGKRIAYNSYANSDYVVSVINADGTNRMSLTDRFNVHFPETPVFSPDGKQIAFSAYDPAEAAPPHTYVIDAAGTSLRKVSDQGGSLTDWIRK
jgi:Tol biopolymer transport system component